MGLIGLNPPNDAHFLLLLTHTHSLSLSLSYILSINVYQYLLFVLGVQTKLEG